MLWGRWEAGDDIPGQEFLDAADGVVGHAGEHLAQVFLGVQVVEFGGAEQTVKGDGALPTGIGTGKVFRPTATARRARSAALLSICN